MLEIVIHAMLIPISNSTFFVLPALKCSGFTCFGMFTFYQNHETFLKDVFLFFIALTRMIYSKLHGMFLLTSFNFLLLLLYSQ